MTDKVNAVSIAVTRVTGRVSDGAGGYTETESSVTGSPFAGRLIRKKNINSFGLVDAKQGDILTDRVVLAFIADSDIRTNDKCTVDGTVYIVQNVRSYLRSVQADAEAVE